jgi:hypothetical protein
MNVDAEMLAGPVLFVVYKASVGLWSDGEIADDDQKARILNNIATAFAAAGLKVDFE